MTERVSPTEIAAMIERLGKIHHNEIARAAAALLARLQREREEWNYDMKSVPTDGSHFVVLCRRMDETPIAWKPYQIPEAQRT